MKKKIFSLCAVAFTLLFLKAQALPIETAKKFDEANQNYILSHFEEAKLQYQDFITTAQSQKPNATDKKLIDNAKESLEELHFLLTHKNLIALFKQGVLLETTNIKDARDTYFQINSLLKEQKITEIAYFSQITQGIVELYLVQKKKDSLENFSASFLEQIKEDKQRKKTLTFFNFQKDPTVEFDIETLVVQNLTNIIQSSKSFALSSKNFTGSLEEQLELAKESNIDLAVTGSYQKAKGHSVMLNFIVFDTYKKKQLIEVSVRAPLDFEFFDAIEKVASDLNKNLRNYSRFEDFDSIRYAKEEGKKLVKEVVKDESKKDNLPLYVDNKILQLENAYIAWLLENTPGFLPAFNLALEEINHFNQRHFDLKIEQEGFLSNKRHEIVQAFVKETKFNTLKENLSLQKEQQNYKKYFSLYQEAKDLLKKGKTDYQTLAPFFYEDLEIPLDNDKAQIEEHLALIEKLSVVKYGVGLGGQIGQGKILSWETNSEQFFGSKTKKNDSLFAQLLWDYRLEKNLWFYAGLGFGQKSYSVDYEDEPADIQEKHLKQNFILIDLGIKVDLWQNLQLTYGLASYFYFQSNNPLFSLSNGPPLFSVGLEYSFINSTWLNISLGLNYLYPWGEREIKSDSANFLEMKEHSFKAALNFYYQSYDYYLSDASPPWDIYLGIAYTHFSFNTKKDKTGDLWFSKTVPGILVGVQLNSYLFLAFNTALFFTAQEIPHSPQDNDSRYHAKGIIQSFNCEVIFASFYQFNLYLTGSIGYVYFYDKNYERYDDGGGGKWNSYSRIPSAVFLVNPIGFGLNYNFNSKIRFKFFMHAPSIEEWGKLFLWNAGGKLEIKF